MGFNASTKRRKHSKPGEVTVRPYFFRIEANREGAAKLHATLDLVHELRNDQARVLEENRIACRAAKQSGLEPEYIDAMALKQMVAGSRLDPKFGALHSQVRQDVSLRVSEGNKRWLEAIREGRSGVKPPRPIARKHVRSFTYPQYGTAAKISNGRLHLSKLGEFRLIGWRKTRGAKRSVTIKWKDGHFWAIVMCQAQERDVCRPYSQVREMPEAGIDPGLKTLLTDSYGKDYEAPKPLKAAQKKLRHLQKAVSRKFEMRKTLHGEVLAKARAEGHVAPVAEGVVRSLSETPYPNRLRRAIVRLARAHTKVANVRKDAAAKTARRVERTYSRVAVEEHGLNFMMRNRRQAKAAADVAIGAQKMALRSALGTGRYFEAANRRPEGGNSQTCLCGTPVPKALKDRWHACPACGLQGPRDQVSAIIAQHETFGSLPRLDTSAGATRQTLGLSDLERAVKALEQGRGESKRGSGESLPAESRRKAPFKAKSKSAVEPSVKRSTPRKGSMPTTAGARQSARAGAKTIDHAGPACSWSIEAQSGVTNMDPTGLNVGIPGLVTGSPFLQVGE